MPGARSKYGNRQDSNHDELAAQFEAFPGVQVIDTSGVGDDFPDLVIGLRGAWVMVEIKSATGSLSPGQRQFHALAVGPTAIVRCALDVRELVMGFMRSGRVPPEFQPTRSIRR